MPIPVKQVLSPRSEFIGGGTHRSSVPSPQLSGHALISRSVGTMGMAFCASVLFVNVADEPTHRAQSRVGGFARVRRWGEDAENPVLVPSP